MVYDDAPGGDGGPAGDGPAASAGRRSDGRDPVAAELRALFAVALAGEPPSSLTPLAVLRRARQEAAERRYRRITRIRRWAGGAVAAAAVIAAVVLLGPLLGHRSGGPAGTAGGALDRAPYGVAASAAAGSAGAGAAEGAGSGASCGPSCAYDVPASAEPNVPSQDGSADENRAAATSAASGEAAEPGTAGSEAAEPSTAGSGRTACMLPPLLPADRAAAIDAMPAGTLGGIAPAPCGSNGAGGATTGTVLRTTWPSGEVRVVVASGATDAGSDAAGTVASTAADGSVTVSDRRGAVVIAVTANPAAAARLTLGQLDAIAAAVRDATR